MGSRVSHMHAPKNSFPKDELGVTNLKDKEKK